MIPAFFAVDLVWLGVVAKDIYAKEMGDLLAKSINWPAAFAFYFIFIFGVLYFAVLPAVDKDSFTTVLRNGALFGFLAYATYDLTNLATTEGWPTKLVFIDMAWGTVLSLSVATAGWYIAQWVR
jgi:uncharacterized membrane protein